MGLFSKLGKNKQEAAEQDSGHYTSADDQAMTERARSKRASSADGPARSRGRGGKEREADDPVLPEKKRARRRLVGAIALALAVAVGLPMVLDSEPKQLSSDIEIKIPSKDKTADPVMPPPAAPIAASAALDSSEEIVNDPAKLGKSGTAPLVLKAAPAIAVPPAVAEAKPDQGKDAAKAKAEAKLKADHEAAAKADAQLQTRLDREATAKAEPKADAKAESKTDTKADAQRKVAKVEADAKPAAKPAAKDDKPAQSEDARALAILEGKQAAAKPAADSGQKFVLQVAALADQDKVDELRERLKKAGIASYTQKTPSGDRIRIRVGPFTSKDEAEKVRAKLSGMGLTPRLETV